MVPQVLVMAYIVMAYIVMANIVMAGSRLDLPDGAPGVSDGVYSYGRYSYGVYSYGLPDCAPGVTIIGQRRQRWRM